MEINMDLRRCPYCGSEMIGNMTSPICANPKCEFYQVPVPVEYVEDLVAYRSALAFAIDALNKCKTREHIGAVCRTPAFVDGKIKEIEKILKDTTYGTRSAFSGSIQE